MGKKKETKNQEAIIQFKEAPGYNLILNALQKGYNLPESYFDIEVEKATRKDAIRTALRLEYLTGPRFRNFYVDTDEVRNYETISSLTQLLADPLEPYSKLLFSGFTGSGKTTELIRLCFQLQHSFNIIIFSAWSRIKVNEITFESILYEIVGMLMDYLYAHQLVNEDNKLLAEISKNIYEWCSKTEIITEKTKQEDKSIGGGINLLKTVFFRATKESKHVQLDRTISTHNEERRLYELIFECNKIFD